MCLQQKQNEMAFACHLCRISTATVQCTGVQISLYIVSFDYSQYGEGRLVSNISTPIHSKTLSSLSLTCIVYQILAFILRVGNVLQS